MTDVPEPVRGEHRLDRLLAGMRPRLDPLSYAFCHRLEGTPAPEIVPRGIFREAEGVTLILEAGDARRSGLVPSFLARRIELTVNSDLNAVGFLARIGQELTSAGIPCNVVSAVWHDHLYVPEAMAERALQILLALEAASSRPEPELIYAVTVQIDEPLAAEWLEWMRSVHVPDVLATGCFRGCTIQRVTGLQGDGRAAFVLEYRCPSAAGLEHYQRNHAPALQQAHSARYHGRFEASRSIRSVLAELPASLA
jgi:uncharacterized protein